MINVTVTAEKLPTETVETRIFTDQFSLVTGEIGQLNGTQANIHLECSAPLVALRRVYYNMQSTAGRKFI